MPGVGEIQQVVLSRMEALVAWLPVGYAFGAGMVSAVNPCGFAMLPAYLSLCLGVRDPEWSRRGVARRVLRALGVGLSASAGFVLLFGVVGAAVSAGGGLLLQATPWLAAAIGASLVALGLAMLAGRTLSAGSLRRVGGRVGPAGAAGVGGFFLFGVAFAGASLSCTLPIFLMVVGSALASGGFLAGLAQFVTYGFGMGLVLVGLTLATAFVREGLIVGGLRRALPWTERAAAGLVLLSGCYILYYWLIKGGLAASLWAGV